MLRTRPSTWRAQAETFRLRLLKDCIGETFPSRPIGILHGMEWSRQKGPLKNFEWMDNVRQKGDFGYPRPRPFFPGRTGSEKQGQGLAQPQSHWRKWVIAFFVLGDTTAVRAQPCASSAPAGSKKCR